MRYTQYISFLQFLLPVLFFVSCKEKSGQPGNSSRPNVIIVYLDDLGIGDVSCYGATAVKTPNVDRLAAEGIRFT
ncbi:MAG: sulfatase-like hydrolase/transferase, partial [Niabella sp.]